jgi:hypothetical protein
MTLCSATFEAGTNGSAIATGDTGAATQWNAVTLGTSATGTYSNSSPAVGALCGVMTTPVGATTSYLEWVAALGTVTNHYGRFYLKTNLVNSTRVYASCYSGAAGLCAYIFCDGTGHLGIDASAGGTATCTVAISANTWYRVEYHIVHSATVGQVSISFYASIESNTPTDSATTAANVNTLASGDRMRFGIGCGVTTYASTTVGLDNIVAGSPTPVGPSVSGLYQPGFGFKF